MRYQRLSLTAFSVSATALLAAGQHQVCFNDSVPLQTTNWITTVSVQKFDPGLGVLQSVDFELSGGLNGSAAIESLDALPTVITTDYRAAITLTRPDLSVLVVAIPQQMFVDSFTSFDGTIDFGGTSGKTHMSISVMDLQVSSSTAPADLASFTGPAGNPGSITLPIDAAANSVANGSGNVTTQFLTDADAAVKVCYNYDLDCNANGTGDSSDISGGASNDHDSDGIPDECQPGFRPFCEGDGASVGGGADCPCGNNGNPGEGCDNGSGTGALLTASGIPSVSNDTLMLTASQIPSGAPGLFFASAVTEASGAGTPWDMGLRCLGQPINVQKLNNGGTIPLSGAPTLSVFLGVAPGDTNYFQYWYRNATGPCNGSANASNGIEVTWGL